MMAHSMARRNSKKSRRRRTTSLSLIGLAETAVIGSAATQMFFGTNLISFLTGYADHQSPSKGYGWSPGADGKNVITLPELLGFTNQGWAIENVGGNYGPGNTFMSSVNENIGKNFLPSLATAFVAPIAFRFAKKTFRKPITMVNRQLKGTGVKL
jgi:hypothetical protein